MNEWEAQNRGVKVARMLAAAERLDLTAWEIALDAEKAELVLREAGYKEASKTSWEWLFTAMARQDRIGKRPHRGAECYLEAS